VMRIVQRSLHETRPSILGPQHSALATQRSALLEPDGIRRIVNQKVPRPATLARPPMAKDLTTPDPSIALELIESFRPSTATRAAVALGVVDALAAGPKSAAELAGHLRVSPDALERLLDACVGLRLLGRQGDRYENAPVATAYLTATSPHRLTGYINYSNDV